MLSFNKFVSNNKVFQMYNKILLKTKYSNLKISVIRNSYTYNEDKPVETYIFDHDGIDFIFKNIVSTMNSMFKGNEMETNTNFLYENNDVKDYKITFELNTNKEEINKCKDFSIYNELKNLEFNIHSALDGRKSNCVMLQKFTVLYVDGTYLVCTAPNTYIRFDIELDLNGKLKVKTLLDILNGFRYNRGLILSQDKLDFSNMIEFNKNSIKLICSGLNEDTKNKIKSNYLNYLKLYANYFKQFGKEI